MVLVFDEDAEYPRSGVVSEGVDIFVALPVGKAGDDGIPFPPLLRDGEQHGRHVAHGDALRVVDEVIRPAQGDLHHAVAGELVGVGGNGDRQQAQPRAEALRLYIISGGIAEDVFTV